MSEEDQRNRREALKAAKKALLLEQFDRQFERDWAELERLAAEYPGLVTLTPGGKQAPETDDFPKAAPPVSEPLEAPVFLGTVPDLIARYRDDPRSGFSKLRFKTRENYEAFLRRLATDLGDVPIRQLDTDRMTQAYEDWKADGRLVMAHSLMGSLRRLAKFGAVVLKDPSCRDLRFVLHDMRLPKVKPRTQRLTAEHAIAIRAKAHEMGLPAIALAQAVQFETPLRQKDVIGEWVPISEHGTPSDVIDGEMKWLRGLRWSAIDQNLILRHTISKTQTLVEVDLRKARMVMEEFARLKGERPSTSDPIIINKATGLPYIDHAFRRMWRIVATAAGVPKGFHNMDNRGDDGGSARGHREKESAR